ncbi:MAG: hypothetical protein R3360_02070 [Alphaproteobacteria bacterium]|nr:hypothetical protein [Alphaproteobacteria bacterium]
MSDWDGVGQVPREQLIEARQQAHHGVQWLARVARNFIPRKNDDSHTALHWNNEHDALMLSAIQGGAHPFQLGLRLPDLSLIVVTDKLLSPVPLLGRKERQVESLLSATLLELGMDRDESINFRRLPYALPDHDIASGGTYGDNLEEAALEELTAWYRHANGLLDQVKNSEPEAGPIRCWPHHFDIATLMMLDEGEGKAPHSIGVGLSPGDEHYDLPYLYVTPWPYPDKGDHPTLKEGGHWHTVGFTAAVLNADKIADGADPHDFTDHAIQLCRDLLDYS